MLQLTLSRFTRRAEYKLNKTNKQTKIKIVSSIPAAILVWTPMNYLVESLIQMFITFCGDWIFFMTIS